MFFVRTANPAAGVDAPIDDKVPWLVFAQKLGVITHAGITSIVALVMTYVRLL